MELQANREMFPVVLFLTCRFEFWLPSDLARLSFAADGRVINGAFAVVLVRFEVVTSVRLVQIQAQPSGEFVQRSVQ